MKNKMASSDNFDDSDSSTEGETNLAPNQVETVNHFREISGLDFSESCIILENNDWNLEVAVNNFMGITPSPPPPPTTNGPNQEVDDVVMDSSASAVPTFPESFVRHRGETSASSQTTQVWRDRPPEVDLVPRNQRIIRPAFPRRQYSWIRWTFHLFSFPFNFVYTTFVDVIVFLLSFLRPDPRRQVTDPEGDVLRFIEEFEKHYGTEHPPFFRGSYSQALQMAKRDLKFLIVYLHGDTHEDSVDFCSRTLCHPSVISALDNTVIFWGCNINSPEGFRVSQNLREHTYPFLAVVVLQRTRMSLVARIEGFLEPDQLVEQLRRVMTENEFSLITARADRAERQSTQLLRQEQDAAYMESLRQDQEKEARRKAEVEAQLKEEADAIAAAEEESRKLAERERLKASLKERLPGDAENEEGVIKIMIKFPDGSRVERRFYETDSVKLLYYFVLCQDTAPENFEIIQNFPKRPIQCQPQDVEWTGAINREPRGPTDPPSFKELKIKNEMVFVRDCDA